VKPLLRALGWIFAVVATAYFLWFAFRSFRSIDLSGVSLPGVALAFVAATLLYSAIVPISAWAWERLLLDLGTRARFGELFAIFAATQIAKYVPGSVAQPLGRVALSAARGYSKLSLAVSISIETLLAALAGVASSCLLVFDDSRWNPAGQLLHAQHSLAIGVGLLIAAVVAVWLTLPVLLRLWHRFAPGSTGTQAPRTQTLLLCFAVYVANYVLIGFALYIVAIAISGARIAADPAFYIGAFSLAWLVGFVAPGAPAGLGVREAVLTSILGQVHDAGATLAIVLLLRLATVAGDGAISACGAWAYRRLGSIEERGVSA